MLLLLYQAKLTFVLAINKLFHGSLIEYNNYFSRFPYFAVISLVKGLVK